jgi:hypothetical protein
MRHSSYHYLVQLALCSVWLLSACGGGGSSGSAPSTYSIGGKLSGLGSGASVVLQDNGGNSTTVSANGSFRFSTQVADGAAYAVTILTHESVIYTFGALPVDGSAPLAMIQGSDGNFYGATGSAGTNNLGTVFKF